MWRSKSLIGVSSLRFDLVASDFDMTIASPPASQLSERTARALNAVVDSAVPLAIVSGRPTEWLQKRLHSYGLMRAGVFLGGYNGTHIVDAGNGELLGQWDIALGPLRSALAIARRFAVEVSIPFGGEIYVSHAGGVLAEHEVRVNSLREVVLGDLTEIPFAPLKVQCAAEPETAARLTRQLNCEMGDQLDVALSAPFLVEITAVGANKGTALTAIAERCGVPLSSALAFGDNDNDVPLLESAGFGVAVGNATAALVEVADRVVERCEDDGVARFLEGHL